MCRPRFLLWRSYQGSAWAEFTLSEPLQLKKYVDNTIVKVNQQKTIAPVNNVNKCSLFVNKCKLFASP